MTVSEFSIKIAKIDAKSGTVRLLMPDGSTHGWSHFDWSSRKRGLDFVNKFLLSKIMLPDCEHISVEHHKNWDRMWAYCDLDSFPLGIEYGWSCSKIPCVRFSLKCESFVDFEQSGVFAEFGGLLKVPGSRQFYDLDNSMCREFLENGWCRYDSGPSVLSGKMMILPRLIRLKGNATAL